MKNTYRKKIHVFLKLAGDEQRRGDYDKQKFYLGWAAYYQQKYKLAVRNEPNT